MKIIFMGTPDFSIPALQSLIDASDLEVVAVYTRAPKEAKRGQKILKSPIHELALANNIEVFTPNSLKNEEEVQKFRNLQADLALIVAYGLILPKNILESTKFGCINIHPSLLPKYRGATPIQSALLNGDDKSGVSIIKMDEGVDSGDILKVKECELSKNDDYPILATKFSDLGAKMAVEVIREIRDGQSNPISQDDEKATFSKKILKKDAKIDLNDYLLEILNKIRAFSDFMTAFIDFRGEKIKIYQAKEVVSDEIDQNFVEFEGGAVNKDFVFKCKNGYFQPQILQRPGKNRVAIQDFLRGFRI